MKNYIKAARLRTLPLSLSGILVGTGIAVSYHEFDIVIFVLALLTTVGFQVLSNFANDYGDGIKGTDAVRTGEARLVAAGVITAAQMKKAVIVTAIGSFVIALALIYKAFGIEKLGYILIFIFLGVACIFAAIKYTVGKGAYGYYGLGDLFVFVFFGLVSVVGGFFLYTQDLPWKVFLPAAAIGLLSVAVLNLNNMRDRENDSKSGKITLVVKMGGSLAKFYHYYLVVLAMLLMMFYSIISFESKWEVVYLVAYIPLIKHLITVKNNKELPLLDKELKKVALSTFLLAILFLIGKFLS